MAKQVGSSKGTAVARRLGDSAHVATQGLGTVREPHAIHLHPRLERGIIKRVFAASGRVHVPGILVPDAAERLYGCLAKETPWVFVFNDGEKVYDLGAEQLAALPKEKRIALSEHMDARARHHFQFAFNSFRMDEAHRAGTHRDLYLMRIYDFVNSEEFLSFAREVTGLSRIAFADAQATMYRPGHFLTRHDDDVAGKNRLAAYVFNLTPRWHTEWGGILQFTDNFGHVAEGYMPSFNALNLFRVPQPHLVSYVAPYAGAPRLSITGWLRER